MENRKPNSESDESNAFHISSEPVVQGKPDGDAHKYEAAQESQTSSAPSSNFANDEAGTLPQSYGKPTLFLIARDPHWLFCYWDFDFSHLHASEMRDGQWQLHMKVFANGEETAVVPIEHERRHWYLPADKAGAEYYIEMGYFDKAGNWKVQLFSNHAQTPSDSVAPQTEAEFVTIPVRIAFHRLLETLKESMHKGETLGEALARLQSEGRELANRDAWNDEERHLLGTLMGVNATRFENLSSDNIDQILRKELDQRMHSESALELFASGLWGPGAGSLFSAFGAFGSAGAFGSETLSSFGGSLSSLSSPFGASWSAQPFSQPRGFFLHVNAEVIFYGGTQPGSKVVISGKEVPIDAEGRFFYHFKFPDGDFEMPVVATSPDGVETRSATLSFRRDTARTGDVGHTAQPPHLGEPQI